MALITSRDQTICVSNKTALMASSHVATEQLFRVLGDFDVIHWYAHICLVTASYMPSHEARQSGYLKPF